MSYRNLQICGEYLHGVAGRAATCGNRMDATILLGHIHAVAMNLNYYANQPDHKIIVCKACRAPVVIGASSEKPEERGLCGICDLWRKRVEELFAPLTKEDEVYSVLAPRDDGFELLSVKPGISKADSKMLGFGGQLWRFEMPWGEVVESNDVWSGGYLLSQYHTQLDHRKIKLVK